MYWRSPITSGTTWCGGRRAPARALLPPPSAASTNGLLASEQVGDVVGQAARLLQDRDEVGLVVVEDRQGHVAGVGDARRGRRRESAELVRTAGRGR